MKIFSFIFCVASLLITLSGCWHTSCVRTKSCLLLVDVNDAAIYNDCHIKGAVNVPFDQVESFARSCAHKDEPVVVYCANHQCTASGHAARIFQQNGFKNVHVYEAGIAGWYQAKLPYEGTAQQGFLKLKNEPAPEIKIADIKVIDTDQLNNLITISQGHACACSCCS